MGKTTTRGAEACGSEGYEAREAEQAIDIATIQNMCYRTLNLPRTKCRYGRN